MIKEEKLYIYSLNIGTSPASKALGKHKNEASYSLPKLFASVISKTYFICSIFFTCHLIIRLFLRWRYHLIIC